MWRNRRCQQPAQVGVFALMMIGALSSCQSGINAQATAADELPSVVQGEAPELGGVPVAYAGGMAEPNGYLALPRGAGMHPGVLLIHDETGLNDRMRQMADQFAAEGYLALAVDLGKIPADSARVATSIDGHFAHLDAAAAFVRAHERCDGRLAAIGWGIGSDIGLQYGLRGARLEGMALFYGSLPGFVDLTNAPRLRYEVYGTFLESQGEAAIQRVERLLKQLRLRGSATDLYVYPMLDEGFWFTPDSDADASWAKRDAWLRLKDYLQRALVYRDYESAS